MARYRILHLEDSLNDAFLIERGLRKAGIDAEIVVASSPLDYITALESASYDLILSDNGVLGLDASSALEEARRRNPAVPFVCISGSLDPAKSQAALAAGVDLFVNKDDPAEVTAAVSRFLPPSRMG